MTGVRQLDTHAVKTVLAVPYVAVHFLSTVVPVATINRELKLEMWAKAQRDGRPAEHRWRPLFNAAKFG